jgi:hypothetical protein
MRAPLCLCLAPALLLACRFGGPGPAPAVDLPDGASSPTGMSAADTAVAADPPAAPDAEPAEAALPAADATPAPDGGCGAPTAPAVCDPVCNTGCPNLSRCDVGEGHLTGACVGIWITGEGQGCARGKTTDSCAVRLTCVEGTCRRLCYRDSDCGAGRCCNSPLPSGFLTCRPCWRPSRALAAP